MKKCIKCQLEQPLNNFTREKAKKDGCRSWCRSCVETYTEHGIAAAKARKARAIADSEKAALATEGLKRCTKCNQVQQYQEYRRNKIHKDGHEYWCKRCSQDSARKRDRKRKQLVIDHYGGRCACCGVDNIEFLAVHHVNGDGREHRKTATVMIISWLINNNFPDGFQILCHNCHLAFHFYGCCPHKTP